MTCAAERHGNRSAYSYGCRCPEAREAHRRYQHWRKRHTAAAAFGAVTPLTVPAAQTRAVIADLRVAGWPLRRIAAATGMDRSRLSKIAGGTAHAVKRVRYPTHQKIAALLEREPALADGAMIDAAPTWRLIHGLVALGYDKAWIARQLGVTRTVQFSPRLVTVANARKVRELADRTITAGPSDAARRYAAERGWTTDLLLDDMGPVESVGPRDDIDPVAVERAANGDRLPLTIGERYAAYSLMRDRDIPGNEIARRLSLSGQRQSEFANRYGAPVVPAMDNGEVA